MLVKGKKIKMDSPYTTKQQLGKKSVKKKTVIRHKHFIFVPKQVFVGNNPKAAPCSSGGAGWRCWGVQWTANPTARQLAMGCDLQESPKSKL